MQKNSGAGPVVRHVVVVETFGVENVVRSSFHIAVGATRFARSAGNRAENARNESHIKNNFAN